MRFQTSKIVLEKNPETVLYALESCLRAISLEVVREGSEITFRGLGPSPRVVNPRDITIFRVETKHDRTVVNVDVTFQPSCLLGESPQDEVVRSKLDSVFEKMSAEIAIDEARELPTACRPATQPAEFVSHQLLISAQTAALEPTSPRDSSAILSGPGSPPQSQTPNLLREAAEGPTFYFNPLLPSATGLISRAPVLIILSLGLLALGMYIARHNHSVLPPSSTKLRATASPIGPYTRSRRPQRPMTAESQTMLSVADPRAWIKNWGAATRTRDPFFQAAFYSNPVDNYFGRRNVSAGEIIEAKKNDIRNRSGLWTVKLEEIVLKRESGGGITVRLVKHYIVQTAPAQISERFVRSQLRLKRLDGKWKIVVEDTQHE